MPETTTPHYPMDALRQQYIVICVVITMAVFLLIGILAIVVSGIVERCRRRRDEDQGMECRIVLTERGGSIVGTISTGRRSPNSPYSPRTGLGYEDMSPAGRSGESVYETVQ